jgi:peptidoglycan hydrolase CwlO-like protein
MNKIWLAIIAVFLIIITWSGTFSNKALSQQVESRLSNLEVDVNSLESRLNQIEAQLGQIRSSVGTRDSRVPTLPQSPRSSGRSLSPQERDRIFDRLATLVIEIRDDIKKLDARVSKLESRR